jgi:hypothetical protein
MNTAWKKLISEGQKKQYARKRQLLTTYEQALKKIHRMKTSGIRARNVAAKALNGHAKSA